MHDTYFWCAVTLVCVCIDALGVNWGSQNQGIWNAIPQELVFHDTALTRRIETISRLNSGGPPPPEVKPRPTHQRELHCVDACAV